MQGHDSNSLHFFHALAKTLANELLRHILLSLRFSNLRYFNLNIGNTSLSRLAMANNRYR